MKKAILCIGLLAIISGCGESSEKKGSKDGYCTQDTVSTYNSINLYSDTDRVRSECNNLRNLIGDSSCKAENISTGGIVDLSYSGVAYKCDSLLGRTRPAAPAPVETPKKNLAPGIDHIGQCTDQTITQHNDLMFNTKKYVDYSDASYLTMAKANCRQLKYLLEDKSCAAYDRKNGTTTSLAYNDVSELCLKLSNF